METLKCTCEHSTTMHMYMHIHAVLAISMAVEVLHLHLYTGRFSLYIVIVLESLSTYKWLATSARLISYWIVIMSSYYCVAIGTCYVRSSCEKSLVIKHDIIV